jgi:hypothetical protein
MELIIVTQRPKKSTILYSTTPVLSLDLSACTVEYIMHMLIYKFKEIIWEISTKKALFEFFE